jgi:type II secretory pathway pseudopilin PulG
MRQQAGMTILEVLLVIVIGSSIIYLSIQQYLSYRRDSDAAVVQANVNAIFQAMAGYFRANCYGTQYDNSPTPKLIPGVLNPAVSPDAIVPVAIADLIAGGYLSQNAIIPNPIVNAGGAGTGGYVAQFNRQNPPSNRQICTSSNCETSQPIGQIYTWQIQVSAQLHNTATTTQFFKSLGGNCLSSSSGSSVAPCPTTGVGSGIFVVWTRLPGLANTQAKSDYWVTTPTVSQFTQMYTTYPITTLTDGSMTADQYYTCGN